jgi:hypothetical protein
MNANGSSLPLPAFTPAAAEEVAPEETEAAVDDQAAAEAAAE